jgi:hypothetical protein
VNEDEEDDCTAFRVREGLVGGTQGGIATRAVAIRPWAGMMRPRWGWGVGRSSAVAEAVADGGLMERKRVEGTRKRGRAEGEGSSLQDWGDFCVWLTWGFARRFTPGFHMSGLSALRGLGKELRAERGDGGKWELWEEWEGRGGISR